MLCHENKLYIAAFVTVPQNFCRIGDRNHSKDTSNQTWQINAFTGKRFKILPLLFSSFAWVCACLIGLVNYMVLLEHRTVTIYTL